MSTFEKIPSTGQYYPTVHRIEVPGGWIYYIEPSHREPLAVFVPTPPPSPIGIVDP